MNEKIKIIIKKTISSSILICSTPCFSMENPYLSADPYLYEESFPQHPNATSNGFLQAQQYNDSDNSNYQHEMIDQPQPVRESKERHNPTNPSYCLSRANPNQFYDNPHPSMEEANLYDFAPIPSYETIQTQDNNFGINSSNYTYCSIELNKLFSLIPDDIESKLNQKIRGSFHLPDNLELYVLTIQNNNDSLICHINLMYFLDKIKPFQWPPETSCCSKILTSIPLKNCHSC